MPPPCRKWNDFRIRKGEIAGRCSQCTRGADFQLAKQVRFLVLEVVDGLPVVDCWKRLNFQALGRTCLSEVTF
jgi:hypothetical protein